MGHIYCFKARLNGRNCVRTCVDNSKQIFDKLPLNTKRKNTPKIALNLQKTYIKIKLQDMLFEFGIWSWNLFPGHKFYNFYCSCR